MHFCHLHGSFCIPSENHEVDLLLRYRFQADVKASFSVLEKTKSLGQGRLGSTEGRTTIELKGVDVLLYMGQYERGIVMQKKGIFSRLS